MDKHSQPPISDYGYIGDCHSAALISKQGSIDWCCMPRIDSASCFGRLLGWKTAGYCQISPTDPFETSRSYIESTMILQTCFKTKDAEAKILDFFPMCKGGQHHPHQQMLRIVEGISGTMTLNLDIVPRFDYGSIKPWIRRYKKTAYIAMGGNTGLLISGDIPLTLKDRHHLFSSFQIIPKQRAYLSILSRRPEDLDEILVEVPSIDELDCRLEETKNWWENWVKQGEFTSPYAPLVFRSALILKSLSNAPTGAIAAAATTSVPESPGGDRNWDYRYCWIRDSYYSVRALARLGFVKEADGFRRFIERSAQSSVEGLQTMFGVSGERRLHEYVIEGLQGYRGAKPVRVGNAAEKQLQLDMYGALMDLAWSWHNRGHTPDEDYWNFLTHIVNFVCHGWEQPDHGIWEVRGAPRHFVHSKVMCWAAVNCGVQFAQSLGDNSHIKKWKEARDAIRTWVEEKGYDHQRGVFIQALGYPEMDAALLMLPFTGFIDFTDGRMIRTANTIQKELEEDGLLKRYPQKTDCLNGEEGAFVSCSFWLAICYARQGRLEEAQKIFKRCIDTGNDLGLFSEEYDTKYNEMSGNFPQALTHLSLIAAAFAINEAGKKLGLSLL